MRKIILLCVVLAALVFAAAPEAAYAQNAQDPGPEWNIRLEFRYSKGQESKLNIPNAISRYGRNYHLVSKSDPVLEKTLPASRTYKWLIDGTIPQDEIAKLEGIEGIVLTETDVAINIVSDKTEFLTGLPTNDVDALPLYKSYDGVDFARAVVRFDIEENDELGLPASYEAEVIFRGFETYIGPGYEVSATYTTKEELDGVPVYVVVATYAPDGLAPIADTGGGTAVTGNTDTAPPETPNDAIVPTADLVETDIGDEAVPQASGGAAKTFNPLLLIPIIIGILAAAFVGWMFWTRHKAKKEKEILREEKRKAVMRSHGLVEYDG